MQIKSDTIENNYINAIVFMIDHIVVDEITTFVRINYIFLRK